MASNDEDVDLQALRSAVLASVKTKGNSGTITENSNPQEDEDDLEALRQAALSSKRGKKPVNQRKCPQILTKSSNFKSSLHNQHMRWMKGCRRNYKSNLIEIKTIPLDEVPPEKKQVQNFAFSLKSTLPLSNDEDCSSSPKPKPKSNDKFSRFESDSDSGDDSDYDYLDAFITSDDSEMVSSTADEKSCDASTVLSNSNGFLNSDKENDDSNLAFDGRESFQKVSENSVIKEDNDEAVKSESNSSFTEQEESSKSSYRDDETSVDDLNSKNSSDTQLKKESLSVEQCDLHSENTDALMPTSVTDKVRSAVQDDSKPVVRSNLDLLEARKKKFELPPIVNPSGLKISLRNIVSDRVTSEVRQHSKGDEKLPESSHSTTICSRLPTVVENTKSSFSEESADANLDSVKQSQGLSVKNCNLPVCPVSRSSILNSNPTCDLRESLKQRRKNNIVNSSNSDLSTSSSSEETSSSDESPAPTLKSVLSVVKMDTQEKETSKKEFNRRPQTSFFKENSKTKSADVNSGKVMWTKNHIEVVSNKNSKNIIDDNENFSRKVWHQDVPNKLPVHMRLGFPVNKSSPESYTKQSALAPFSSTSTERAPKRKQVPGKLCSDKLNRSRKRVRVKNDACIVVITNPFPQSSGNLSHF